MPPGGDCGRAVCSCKRVSANEITSGWAQGVKRSDGRANVNRCMIDAAAWDRRLWEPGVGREQQCFGWNGSRGLDGGVGVCARNGQTRVHELVGHRGL